VIKNPVLTLLSDLSCYVSHKALMNRARLW